MIARTFIDIGLAPRVRRHFFLEIRPVPTVNSARLLIKRGESLLRRWISADIETKRVERRPKELNLGLGRFRRRLLFLPDKLEHHEAGEQSDNRHYDQQLDQCKATGIY